MRISKIWLKGMHGLRAIFVSFTGKAKISIISLTTRHRKPRHTIPSNLYHRCSELPLSVFITCTVDKDYRGLVKYGHATQSQLNHCWNELYSEYAEISGGDSYKLLMNLTRDIGYLESKLLCIGLCLKVLTHRPDEKCIKILHNYGYKYVFDIKQPELYAKNLETVAIRAGAVKLSIQQKRAELDKKQGRTENKPITRETFAKILASLSKHMGFRIDPQETTVSEFVSYRHNLESEIEYLKKSELKEQQTASTGANTNLKRG